MATIRWMGPVAALLLCASCIRGEQAKPDSDAEVDATEATALAQVQRASDERAAKKAAAKAEAERKKAEQAANEKAAAEKAAHTTVTLSSKSPEAVEHFQLAFQWYFAGHESKAVAELEAALSFDEGFLLAQSYLFLNTPGADSMKNAAKAAEQGASLPEPERTELEMNAATKSAEYGQADEMLAKLIALAPGDWRVQMFAGGNAWRTRNLEGAIAAYSKAVELNPKAFAPHVLLAAMASLKGDHATEFAEVQKAIAAQPGEAVLQDDLVQALISAGRLDDASAALDVEKKMASAGWEVHASWAALAFLRGEFSRGVTEARAAADSAQDENDKFEQQSNLTLAEMIAKRPDEALKTAAVEEKTAQGKNPNYVIAAVINRGLIQLDGGHTREAINSFGEALIRTDKEGLSATGRARFKAELEELLAWAFATEGKGAGDAADLLAKELGDAVSTDADSASQLAFAQGQALIERGDLAGAIASMSKCIPDNDLCRWALVSAEEKSGDKAAADAARAGFLALNHTSYLALWARARMSPPVAAAAPAKPAKPAKSLQANKTKTDLAEKAEKGADKAAGK